MQNIDLNPVLSSTQESLEGKVIIVTGAAQGMGRTVSSYLASRGAIIAALDRQDVSSTIDELAVSGFSSLALQADVSNLEQVSAAVDRVVTEYGRIDGLINGAALFTTLKQSSFLEIDPEEWDRVFQVNTKSVFLCSRAVAPQMIRQKSGSIINIGSNVVSYGMANFLHYVASKSAIVGMSRSIARELGPHQIRVNTVSPGFVTTEITGERSEEYRRGVISTQAITQAIGPTDIAAVLAFLSSDASRMITGQDWLVNGGSHMGPA